MFMLTRLLTTLFLFFVIYSGSLFAFPFAYVSNVTSESISVIDVATNTVIKTISASTPVTASAVTPDATRVYVTTGSAGDVLVIDVATNTIIDTISIGAPNVGIAITPDGTRAYVTLPATDRIAIIDITNNTVIGTINLPAGSGPVAIAITPDGTRAYVTNTGLDSVSPITLANNQVGASIPVGDQPVAIAITPNGKRAYVANTGSDNVTAINLTTNKRIATIPVGEEPSSIAIDPQGKIAYVVNTESTPPFLSRINIATNANLPPFSLSNNFNLAIVITPDGTTAYVTGTSAEASPGSVVPVDLATGALGDPIPVGILPFFISITPVPPPTVISINPTSGPEFGGTVVTITGTHFTGATQVLFGETPATSFVVNSDSSITAVSPAGTGTVDVRVVTSFGTSATTPADQFTYIPSPPTVTGVNPSVGPQSGGTVVTITGTNFVQVAQVLFGTTPSAFFVVNSDSSITAVSPAGTGTVDVRVVTSFGTSATSPADQFTYLASSLPLITSINPSSGPESGGTAVTITGANFTGTTQVLFGGIPATSFVVNSDSSITAISPPGTGIVDVRVITTLGASPVTPADQFTYTAVPLPFSPRNAKGHQVANRFATQTDYINILTWKAPRAGPTPIEYRVYRDAGLHELIAIIAADRELKFKDHNRKKGKTYTYFIVSVDASGLFSEPAVVRVQPIH
jgi:YVTN family beta-propeller protein